ncbi:MAG: hypothetical protein R3B46_05030 [Phycisphaerales bacterium]|nr:hypothetical protein [Phycisphaerales bacterium]
MLEVAMAVLLTFASLMYAGIRSRHEVVYGRAFSGADRTRINLEYAHAGLVVLLVAVLFISCIGLMMRRRGGAKWIARWGYARLILAGLFVVCTTLISTLGLLERTVPAESSELYSSLISYSLPILLVSIAFPLFVLFWLSKRRVGEEIGRWS